MAKSFQPSEFVEAMNKGELQEGLSLVGMVKASEDEVHTIMFSVGRSCANWIKIPLELMEKIEHIDKVKCGDHDHPLIKIVFKAQSGPAGVFLDLLRVLAIHHGEPTVPPTSRMPARQRSRPSSRRLLARNSERCHWRGWYRCSADEPWKDAYGNGEDCDEAATNAGVAYDQICGNSADLSDYDCTCD